MITDHNGLPWNDNGPDLPLIFVGVFFLVALIFGTFVRKCLAKCGMAQDESDCDVDEKLGNYWETVPARARKLWMATELHNQTALGIQSVGMIAREKMRTMMGTDKILKNAPNYEILNNEKYVAAFQYCPISQRDNATETSTSDMVTSILY